MQTGQTLAMGILDVIRMHQRLQCKGKQTIDIRLSTIQLSILDHPSADPYSFSIAEDWHVPNANAGRLC